jgi:hypothetical protein
MSLALVAGRAMEKLMIVCLYELGGWRRDSGFVSVAVYVLYASWTGCAALGRAVNDRERLGCMKKRTCLLLRAIQFDDHL